MEWPAVPHCTLIQTTHCDLTPLIDEFLSSYWVRVQTVIGNNVSEWAVLKKRIKPNESKTRLYSNSAHNDG